MVPGLGSMSGRPPGHQRGRPHLAGFEKSASLQPPEELFLLPSGWVCPSRRQQGPLGRICLLPRSKKPQLTAPTAGEVQYKHVVFLEGFLLPL